MGVKEYNVMKKNISMLFVMAVISIGCTRTELPGQAEGATTLIGAVMADDPADARIGIGEKTGSSYPIIWTEGDCISVNGCPSTELAASSIGSAGKSARFEIQGLVTPPFASVYPLSAVDSYDNGDYTVTLPQIQQYTPGSFDPSAALMYGNSETTSDINFRFFASFISFTINGGDDMHAIKRIEVSSLGDEPMSGSFLLKDGSALEMETENPKAGVVLCSEEGIPIGSSVIVAIAPHTYASGIKVRIVDEQNHFQDIKSTRSFTAASGTVYNTTVNFAPTGTLVDGNQVSDFKNDGTLTPLRILFIGNSHTIDATDLLPFMLNSAGVRDIEITRTYRGGYFLVGYNSNYTQSDLCSIMKWKSGQMRLRGDQNYSHSLKEAVDAGPYDIVVLQEYAGSNYCWDWTKDNYAERTAVNGLISKIREVSPEARFFYYLSHTYGKGKEQLVNYFNNDNVLHFNACIEGNAVHMMDPEEGFGFEHMISTAALMQNLRTSALNIDNGMDLYRGDALHMDFGAVRYAASCLLWKTLLTQYTGIDYKDVPFRYKEFFPSTSGYTTPVTDGNIDVLWAAVDAAYEHPMEITDLSSIPVNTDYVDHPGATTMDLTGVDFEPATFPVDFPIGYVDGVSNVSMQSYWYSHGVWTGTQPQCFTKWISVSRPRQDIVYVRTSLSNENNNLSSPRVMGAWTGDYFEFVIPVRNFAAGTKVNLYIPMYVEHAPIFWYFDYLDGGEWKCNHSELTSYGDTPFTRDATVALNYKMNSINVKMTFENAVPEGYLRFRVRCADGSIQAESGNPVQRNEPNMKDGAYYSALMFWSTTNCWIRFSIEK